MCACVCVVAGQRWSGERWSPSCSSHGLGATGFRDCTTTPWRHGVGRRRWTLESRDPGPRDWRLRQQRSAFKLWKASNSAEGFSLVDKKISRFDQWREAKQAPRRSPWAGRCHVTWAGSRRTAGRCRKDRSSVCDKLLLAALKYNLSSIQSEVIPRAVNCRRRNTYLFVISYFIYVDTSSIRTKNISV